MMDQKFAAYLEVCLDRLDRGENLPAVLADYPDYEEQLKPLLLVAMASRAFPIPLPNQTALRAGKNRLFSEMDRGIRSANHRKLTGVPWAKRLVETATGYFSARGFPRLAPSYRLAAAVLVVALSGGVLTLNASASSQPGDLLFTLKLGLQHARLAITFDEAARQALELQFAGKQRADIGPLAEFQVDLGSPLKQENRSSLVVNGEISPTHANKGPGPKLTAETAEDKSLLAEGFYSRETNVVEEILLENSPTSETEVLDQTEQYLTEKEEQEKKDKEEKEKKDKQEKEKKDKQEQEKKDKQEKDSKVKDKTK